MVLRAVIFDCGGVLYGHREPIGGSDRRKQLERENALPKGVLRQTLREAEAALPDDGTADHTRRLLAQAQRRLEAICGRELPPLHEQLHRDKHRSNQLFTDNIDLVRQLRPAYRTAVLANSNGGIARRLAVWGIDSLFDSVFDSGVEGIAKPDPRAYEITAQRLGASPSECVFVDNTELNVARARELGMTALHFDAARGDDLRTMLVEAGVRELAADRVGG